MAILFLLKPIITFSDLVAENIDIAFRVGPLPDSSAIATPLWDIPFYLVAHQQTIEKYNIDANNFQLKDLSTLPCAVAAPQRKWVFSHHQHGRMVITPNASLQANDLGLVLNAAKALPLIAYIPVIVFKNVEGTQQMVRICGQGWEPQMRTLYAVYTGSRRSSQKVKSVIAHVKQAYFERFGEDLEDTLIQMPDGQFIFERMKHG